VKSDNSAQVRPVEVDFIEGNIAVVRTGLTPGEQVVIDGQDKLQEGTKLSFKLASAGPASSETRSQGNKQ